MASTYSALKIELIATGEQSGVWGDTTNTNLGTALGEAITGSADVAFSSAADVTVTLTDSNAAQTARNLRLNITESGAGIGYVGNLILGSGCQIEKLYLVNNTGTGAKTIKNTTGSGITVPAGKSMFVYNTGTNVVDATTYLSSLTLGSALPVSSGGTGSTSTTFVNLATNVTGTLPIANGGTGSTSTTFVNAATNVTGTLPVANGGTGATSLAAANIASTAYATTATAGGTTTLTASSESVQYFTGTTTQTVVLPVASTLTLGQQYTVHNNSTGDITIQSSGLNVVGTVNAGTTSLLTCILTSGTGAASWDIDNTGFSVTLPVVRGGTGLSTLTTAYGVLAAGTTATGTLQNIGTGTATQVLTSNGPGALPSFQALSGYSGPTIQTFSSPGTFTVPSGITRVKATVIGGGGAGGGSPTGGSGSSSSGGGGSGGLNIAYMTGLTGGQTVSVTVGSGGSSQNASGQSSSFGPGGSPATTITATGGGGGGNGQITTVPQNAGGGGGGGSGGGFGVGIAGSGANGNSGGGGGGATTFPAGAFSSTPGTTTGAYGLINSKGGNGQPASIQSGSIGGGGGGGYGGTFGSGGAGQVIIEY